MTLSHLRAGPEGNDESEHDRMPDDAVEQRRLERDWGIRLTAEMQEHLAQSEQIEVIDQKRGDEHDQPARSEQDPEPCRQERIGDAPDDIRHGAPEPE